MMRSRYYILPGLIVSLVLIFAGNTQAVLSGVCSDCHTMHNSQGGQPVAYQLNTSFTGFDPNATPGEFLLLSNCVGCHASAGSATIVNNVPVVFNTGAFYSPLAGGNFSYVRSDDINGHNVAGIKAEDISLGLTPPGGAAMTSQLTCAGEFGCHGDRTAGNDEYAGLKGAHHTDDSGGITGGSVGLSYRFLNGISGKEDSDWEQIGRAHV